MLDLKVKMPLTQFSELLPSAAIFGDGIVTDEDIEKFKQWTTRQKLHINEAQRHCLIVGVSVWCTKEELAKAYKERAKQFHPDKNPNNPQMVERMKILNHAYDTLKKDLP